MTDTKDHEFNPGAYPPFASNLPVAQLETFKFDTLHADGKSLNGQTLRSACYQHGVFYLDLTDSDPRFNQLPDYAKYQMDRLEPIFDLPQTEKDKSIFADLASRIGGYQRAGASVVNEKHAQQFPETFNEEAVHMLLHRDMGTIAILFHWLGGLQVKDRDTGTMMWVEPKAGHAVVIVGTALARFLDGQDEDDGTFGAWHRLVAAPGPGQGKFARYSLCYFVRPEDDVLLKKATATPLSGELCKMRRTEGGLNRESEEGIPTAKEWISRRAG
ncbi:hypothetical protein LTS15_009284 [Exophiala xenobiotica]|nr:hypothetical protein LTS15_009284 [Exophiala xenobiotica]